MRGGKIYFLLAVLCGVAAVIAALQLLNAFFPQREVLVSAQDLAPAAGVRPNQVVRRQLPAAGLPQDALADVRQLAGMVTKGYIPAGTVLRKAMFQPAAAAGVSGALALLGQDYVAVALPAGPDTTVGGTLRPGDFVDVYRVAEGRSEMLVSGVRVLAAPVQESQKKQGLLSGREMKADAVVLALKRTDSEKVVAAIGSGRIVVVLNPLRVAEGGGQR